MTPNKLFRLLRDWSKFESINHEKGAVMQKLSQYLTLAVSLGGTLGAPALASSWLATPSHKVIYTGLVAFAILLHALFPSIFSAPSDSSKSSAGLTGVGIVLLLLSMGMCVSSASAQTTQPVASTTTTVSSPTFTGSADAVAFRYKGQWSTGSLTTESLDFIDFGKTKSNHVFVEGHELIAPTPGLSIYSGGLGIQPDLTKLLAKTNISSSNLSISFNEGMGVGVPASGGSHFAFIAGGGIKYKATTALTWNALQAQYVRYGSTNSVAISTGLAFAFGK
jgi:hypothetical protein